MPRPVIYVKLRVLFVVCQPGYFISNTVVCEACATGTYSTATNAVACDMCFEFGVTRNTASMSANDCGE